MGHPHDRALAALRLSLGRWTSPEEINRAGIHIAARAQAQGYPGQRSRS
jgi:cysteine sulfinate desulfinase/cysteine desulfurase-like protein